MAAAISRRIAGRSISVLRDQRGQTQTEYLMILGLIAAVILTVFTTIFWPSISGGVSSLVVKIVHAISGGGIS